LPFRDQYGKIPSVVIVLLPLESVAQASRFKAVLNQCACLRRIA
jgi:hypothetical protein